MRIGYNRLTADEFMDRVIEFALSPEEARRYAECVYHVPGDTPSAWACSCDCRSHVENGGNCPGTAFDFVPVGNDVPETVEDFLARYEAGIAAAR